MADWPSDKELEEIYRRGSEGHDFQYNEDAWNDMERLLDKRKRRRFFFFMFSVVVLGTLTYVMLPFTNSNTNSNQNLAETSIDINAGSSTDIVSTNNASTDAASSTQSFLIKNPKSDLSSSSLTNEQEIEDKSLNQAKHVSSSAISSNPKISISQNHPNRLLEQNTSLEKSSSAVELSTPTYNLTNDNRLSNSNKLSTNLVNVEDQEIGKETNTSSKAKVSSHESEIDFGLGSLIPLSIANFPVALNWEGQTPDLAELSPEKKIVRNTFLMGITLGAESSWTPQGEFSSIDMNVGLKGTYYLGNKTGISIGASYINDIFDAPGTDYTAKQDFWKASGAPGSPMMMHAESSMIELSTGITYAFNDIKNNGISVGAHVISNFMLKESYQYLYPNENHNFNSSWTMANSTWLNSLDLSASYRIRLSDSWLLESGPYFKVPIEGIGHGDIKLTSFGIRFSLGFSK